VRRRKPFVAPLALAAALFLLSGCGRKAPGPEECQRFAYLVYGVADGRDVRLARVRADVDELTRECLVTPYDRDTCAASRSPATCAAARPRSWRDALSSRGEQAARIRD
jgi:hypothetical protein